MRLVTNKKHPQHPLRFHLECKWATSSKEVLHHSVDCVAGEKWSRPRRYGDDDDDIIIDKDGHNEGDDDNERDDHDFGDQGPKLRNSPDRGHEALLKGPKLHHQALSHSCYRDDCAGGGEGDVGDNGDGWDGGDGGGGDDGDDGSVRNDLSLLPLLDGALEQSLPPLAILINPFECQR